MSIDRTGRHAAGHRPGYREVMAVPIEPPPPVRPEAVEFVRFCYHRRRVSWPELYDEMCAVAAKGTFRGWAYEELALIGIHFTLSGMPRLVALADHVVSEERQRLGRSAAVASDAQAPAPASHLVPAAG